MYFGVERYLALSNAAALILAIVGLGWWWWILPMLAFHLIMRGVNKRDPLALKVFGRYRLQSWRYDPWPHQQQLPRSLRPSGFMRGQLC